MKRTPRWSGRRSDVPAGKQPHPMMLLAAHCAGRLPGGRPGPTDSARDLAPAFPEMARAGGGPRARRRRRRAWRASFACPELRRLAARGCRPGSRRYSAWSVPVRIASNRTAAGCYAAGNARSAHRDAGLQPPAGARRAIEFPIRAGCAGARRGALDRLRCAYAGNRRFSVWARVRCDRVQRVLAVTDLRPGAHPGSRRLRWRRGDGIPRPCQRIRPRSAEVIGKLAARIISRRARRCARDGSNRPERCAR